MGSLAGLEQHLGLEHNLPEEIVRKMARGIVSNPGGTDNLFAATGMIHKALHANSEVLKAARIPNGDASLCDHCHERPAVVITPHVKRCAPCALTHGILS